MLSAHQTVTLFRGSQPVAGEHHCAPWQSDGWLCSVAQFKSMFASTSSQWRIQNFCIGGRVNEVAQPKGGKCEKGCSPPAQDFYENIVLRHRYAFWRCLLRKSIISWLMIYTHPLFDIIFNLMRFNGGTQSPFSTLLDPPLPVLALGHDFILYTATCNR